MKDFRFSRYKAGPDSGECKSHKGEYPKHGLASNGRKGFTVAQYEIFKEMNKPT